jgi:hypothetical protein
LFYLRGFASLREIFFVLLTSSDTRRYFPEQKKGGFDCVKIPLLFLGLSLTLSAVSQAGPARGGFSGRSFHAGFVARGFNRPAVYGGRFNGGFRGRSFARGYRPYVFQQYGCPVYWYPYWCTDPLDYSYLDPQWDQNYQYWDNSSAYVRPQTTDRAVPQTPVIVVINNGVSRPTDSNAQTDPKGTTNPRGGTDPNGLKDPREVTDPGGVNDPSGGRGYADYSYVSTDTAGQQRTGVQNPNERSTGNSITPGDPVVPQQNTKTALQPGPGVFGKFVIVDWLKVGGKDVISVKNIETNRVQRITSQPNIDHFRIVEIHPNTDLRQFEAIISNGTDQGPVRFQF